VSSFFIKGVLSQEDGATFIEAADGSRQLAEGQVWSGYVSHWLDRPVRARLLAQRDYAQGRPIVLVWPDEPTPDPHYVALYYNERLVGHVASLFGHLAINVDGRVFNFSHLLHEDEEMSVEEFLYRPALGEFAPHPERGGFSVEEPNRPYHSTFGRRFMRSVHELHIRGLDSATLMAHFRAELAAIHATPPDPHRPEKYRDFSFWRRSCATIVRDGLRRAGLSGVQGVLPRDVYLSAAHRLAQAQRRGEVSLRMRKLMQLEVPEAPPSKPTPIFNPRNWWRVPALRSGVAGAGDLLPRGPRYGLGPQRTRPF